jgi:hypothetical protein
MTLQKYLDHRRRYEIIVLIILLVLFGATNATSIILEDYQNGADVNWLRAFATEYTAVLTIPLLFPLLLPFLDWLNLNFENLRWRVLWHLPGILVFSLLHIALFNIVRKLLWPLAGQQYEFGPLFLGLLYELRKVFWAYLIIVTIIYSYRFILNRLQGEARFLSFSDESVTQPKFRDQFLVKMLDKEYLVRVIDIQWIQSASNYVLLHCGDRQYPMRNTLKGLSEQLDPNQFLRIHRTAIVNLKQVVSLQDKGDVKLNLATGETLAVSKTYLPQLRQALESCQSQEQSRPAS